MRIYKIMIPILITLGLMAGCSNPKTPINVMGENKVESSQAEEHQRLEVERALTEKLRAEQEAKATAEAKAAADALAKQQEEAKQQAAPKPKVTTTTQKPKTTTPTTKPTTNNGRPDIPTKYAYEFLKAVEDEIVVLCNQERANAGLSPLSMNETLRQSARYKSNEMLQYNYFEHVSPITGFKPWDIAKTYGYSYTAFGENIYMCEGLSKAKITAKQIVDGWMNSPGHKANILNTKYGRIGVGVVFTGTGNKCEATQQFSN